MFISGVGYLVAVCMRFSWEISLCTMPGLYFQQLSHSWGTQHLLHPKACQQQTTSQCVCVFIFVNECVHVFVCLCMGPRGTEMLVYPSAFVVMFLRTFMTFVNTLLKCHSPGCAYSLRDAYNVHHTSHYSQLESVHDSNWKNRLFKWKSRELELKKGTLILDLLNCI